MRKTVLLRHSHKVGSHYYGVFRCRCGKEFTARRDYVLKRNGTCGCSLKDRVPGHLMHGFARTPEQYTWLGMRQRCLNPRNPSWPRYGGRGITICPQWDALEQFILDMGPKPSPGATLERIDNDGPYSPENCRWATRLEQRWNRADRGRLLSDEAVRAIRAAYRAGVRPGVLAKRYGRHRGTIHQILNGGLYRHVR